MVFCGHWAVCWIKLEVNGRRPALLANWPQHLGCVKPYLHGLGETYLADPAAFIEGPCVSTTLCTMTYAISRSGWAVASWSKNLCVVGVIVIVEVDIT